MNYQEFCQACESILTSQEPYAPYNNPVYLNYTKLNLVRMRRWDAQLKLDELVVQAVQAIDSPQRWLIITEPWCGDGAHVLPLLVKLAALNANVSYDIQLRDQPPHLIDKYLTNGSKSIPKLIVKDHIDTDLFIWGPRPGLAQGLVDGLKAEDAEMDTIANALQHWYNKDRGHWIGNELMLLLSGVSA